MSTIIRKYNKLDQLKLIELIRQNTPEFFAPSEESDLINYLNEEVEDYFIIEKDDEIIGCGGINYEKAKSTGIISWDIISSKHQGLGIGSKLLKYRLNELQKNHEINKVIVRTSQYAYPFYEKHGFELGYIKKDHWGKGFDLYYMELKA